MWQQMPRQFGAYISDPGSRYRYQYLIERGYGNYLGLGQLLGYVCATVGLRPGQLMIVAGVAAVDSAARYRIARLTESAKSQ